MKVELTKVVKEFSGESLKDEAGKVLTIGEAFVAALGTPIEIDKDDTGEQRIHKYTLGCEIYRNLKGKIELNSEDIALLKERVKVVYLSPLVYGSVCEALGEDK